MLPPTDVLQGTLDLLILRTLSLHPMHGWGISQRIQQLSNDVLQVNQGSLYPALHRLEQKGWIDADWGTSENNRRAKFYRLTAGGGGGMRPLRALRALLRRREVERELDDELRFHIDMQAEENVRAGMSAEEARRQAV